MKKKIFSMLALATILFISCTKYIDNIEDKHSLQEKGNIYLYQDSILFVSKPTIGLKMDNVTLYSQPITIKLPKRLKYYVGHNGTDFVFYYDDKQVVYVREDIYDNLHADSIYIPSEIMTKIFFQNLPYSKKDQYKAHDILYDKKRKHLMIQKNNIEILLYNIKDRYFNTFYNYLIDTR